MGDAASPWVSPVQRWKQEHRLYLWRYTENRRNYSGWHRTADDDACFPFVDLLCKMADAEEASYKRLRISPPSSAILRVPNNQNGRAAWQSVETLELQSTGRSSDPDHWLLEASDACLALTLGSRWLQALERGFSGLPKSIGDYCIGPGGKTHRDEQIWFWWFVGE